MEQHGEKTSELVIGIDLGTTTSRAAIFTKGSVKILMDEDFNRATPSNVFFTDKTSVIVGNYARSMADARPEYGVDEMKRLIGRKFDDVFVQRILPYLSYIVRSIRNNPVVLVETRNSIIKKTPQELCAYILAKIKKDAEDTLKVNISKVVVTVPAYFATEQRNAILEACLRVGLRVMKFSNEHTAAAIAYYFESNAGSDNCSIVYDLGGCTFDVAILQGYAGKIEILAVDGDACLGGRDFDNLIVDYVCSYVQRNYGVNLTVDRRTIRLLRYECEKAKECLSKTDSTSINLLGVLPNRRVIEVPLTKVQLENIINELCKKTITIMDRCIHISPIAKTDIKEVVLAGGSTWIPLVQNLISQYFDGKVLDIFSNPNELVAIGAALQAAMLSSHPQQRINEIQLTDFTPLSIGVSVLANINLVLIKRNTKIPTTNNVSLVSVYDQQTAMSFRIYEGERTDARKNLFLGHLKLTGLPPAPPGKLMVNVRAKLDKSGVLTITAKELVTGKSRDLKIAYTCGSKSEAEVQDAIIGAKLAKEEDKRFAEFAQAKSDLIRNCVDKMHQLEITRHLDCFHRGEYNRCKQDLASAETLEMDSIETVQNLLARLSQVANRQVFGMN